MSVGSTACARAAVRVEVLRPGEHVHPEGLADPGDPLPEAPEPEQAERPPLELGADRGLPAAGAQPLVGLRHLPHHCEQQRPGQLRGRARQAPGPAHRDALPGGGRDVDRGVHGPGGHQQLEPVQPRQQAGVERRTLAHRHHHPGVREGLDERIALQVLVDEAHLALDLLPGAEACRRPLVVVEHHDVGHQGSGRSTWGGEVCMGSAWGLGARHGRLSP